MDWDEVRPKPAAEIVVGANLTTLSVAELESRIAIAGRDRARPD